EQTPRVLGHRRGAVKARIVKLLALPVSAIVEGDRPAPRPGQGAQPMRIAPIGRDIGGEAVDQQDRLPLAFVRKGDPHAVRIETLHSCSTVLPPRSLCSPRIRKARPEAVMTQT